MTYTLSTDGKAVDSGTVKDGLSFENGRYYRVGMFPCNPRSDQAVRYTLTLMLHRGRPERERQLWDVWAYPS